MAIVSVKKQFEHRGGRNKIDRGREYDHVYVVETSGVDISEYFVLLAQDPTDGTRIPQPGEQHDDDDYALVQQVDAVQKADSERFWTVRVSYSTIVPRVQEASQPLDRTPKHTWGFLTTTVPYAIDADGDASENSAGVPYDPPLMRSQSIPVLYLRWNTAGFDLALVNSRMDHVNTDSYSVVGYYVPPGQSKLVSWTAEYLSEGGYWFFANSVTLQFRDLDPGWAHYPELAGVHPWNHVIPQYGFSELVPDADAPGGFKRKAILIPAEDDSEDTVQPQDPQKLDDDGKMLEDQTARVHVKIHVPYKTTTFGVLGFPA
jgi:hypothetical protein